MQNTGNSHVMNQQSACGLNHFGQPMQQDPFFNNQQQQNPCVQNVQSVPGNPCLCTPGIGQSHMTPCGNFLPQNILEQIRTCVGNTTPIFILPNSHPIQSQQLPQILQNSAPQVPVNVGYPNVSYPSSIGINYPAPGQNPIFSTPCYPFPVPLQYYDPFGSQNRSQSERNLTGCNCCRRNVHGNDYQPYKNLGSSFSAREDYDGHRCCPGVDDTVCSKANCPASVSLQALASQLLSLQGVIPCAATRLLLRKVPGSNVTTTVEDTMERAQKSIGTLKKEQLINEARNAQQVNGLINLHMMANPPQNIVPILTMLQLKVNSLKSLVENFVNKSISECQTVGTDGNTSFDPMVLGIKSDSEIRGLLATLRQKECEERVNVNYAPYHSQRVVAEGRLSNFQNKINQVESEIERRRAVAMPWANPAGQFHQTPSAPGGNYSWNVQRSQCNAPQGFNPLFNGPQITDPCAKGFDSPSPFMVQVQSPRRLNLKPNVGGPQTTYHQSSEEQGLGSPEAFAVSKLENNPQCGTEKPSSDEVRENVEPSKEPNDPSGRGTEGKKKLKIHIDERGELSVKKKSLEELPSGEFVQLSPDVVIIIDKEPEEFKGEDKGQKNSKKKKKKNNEKKGGRNKSPESIPSDSTYDSETSVSSGAEEKDDEKSCKSILRNTLKGKKKTSTIENSVCEGSHHKPEPIVDGKPASIKKEKHVSVAMLSELSYDRFTLDKDVDRIESESIFLFEHDQNSAEDSGPPVIEQNDEDQATIDTEEELDLIKERIDDPAVRNDLETVYTKKSHTSSITKDASKNNITVPASRLETKRSPSISSRSRAKWSEKTEARSLLREAQNQTVDRGTRSPVVAVKKTLKGSGHRDNKENISKDPIGGASSITGKGNGVDQTLRDSISSMDKDSRKKRSSRFK